MWISKELLKKLKYYTVHQPKIEMFGQSNVKTHRDSLFVPISLMFALLCISYTHVRYWSRENELDSASTYKVPYSGFFNLQILYANEAESINPVEKEKEEQQPEVRCL